MKSWRRSRPFWGGLFILVAGMELLSIPLTVNALSVAIRFGTVGATYLIALIMMIVGVLVWFQPGQRVFLGLVAVLLSMASFVYSNLGGFLVGMTFGLLGGMLAVAWTPVSRPDTRLDTLDVRTVLAAARAALSRTSALSQAVIGEGRRPRWSASVTRVRADARPADANARPANADARPADANACPANADARPADANANVDAVAELGKSAR